MSLTLSCKLVEVLQWFVLFLLQKQAQYSVRRTLALNPAFSVASVESRRYGGLQSRMTLRISLTWRRSWFSQGPTELGLCTNSMFADHSPNPNRKIYLRLFSLL